MDERPNAGNHHKGKVTSEHRHPLPAMPSKGIARLLPEGMELNFAVVLGRSYQLEASETIDGDWSDVGSPFVAESESISQVIGLESAMRFYRLLEVPELVE